MKLLSRNLFAFLVSALAAIPLSACSSDDGVSTVETSPQEQRLMTAPAVQEDIQRAQTAGSLSELYADGEPPKVEAAPRESIQIPEDARTVEDIAQDITSDAQAEAEPVSITDDPSQSNPPNTPEEQAIENMQRAANIAPVQDIGPQLNAGETLKVTVFNDPDLSGEYEIDNRGFITMPLLGDVQAAGRSQNMLKNMIENQLSVNGILVDPSVSIEVITLRPFYILGEVRTPGSYPTVPEMDVFKALAIAGGLTPRAVDDEFIIYRGHGETRQTLKAREDTPVLPGDSIKVKERFF